MVLDFLANETGNIQSKTKVLRQFGKYLTGIGKEAYIIPDNFVLSKSTFTPYIFTDKELDAFFQAVDSVSATKAYPYAPETLPVLFRLIYTCGLRPDEGRELKTGNVNMETGEVLIDRNKRKQERIAVMSDDMLGLCRRYVERRFVLSRDSTFFFPANSDGCPYTTQQLRFIQQSRWKAANPELRADALPPIRPYDLRHRFASANIQRWLDEGRDLNAMLPYLRAYMGHASFNSTAYYVHMQPKNLVQSSGIDWQSFEKLIPEVSE